MSIACLFGYHRPSLQSITRREGGYAAYCESCARPLERSAQGRWRASDPLDSGASRPDGRQSAA